MSDENNLKILFEEAEFIDAVIERINVVSNFESSDDFTTFTIEHGGPTIQKIHIYCTQYPSYALPFLDELYFSFFTSFYNVGRLHSHRWMEI
jgi:hypothetical protein